MVNTVDTSQCGAPNCVHSRDDGYTLSFCNACKVATYCSKECQKAAWPIHKIECKINRSRQRTPDSIQVFSALDAWLNPRRSLLHQTFIAFLNLPKDPRAHEKFAMTLQIDYVPVEKDPIRSFAYKSIESNRLEDLAALGQQFVEALAARKLYDEEARKTNGHGNGLVVLVVHYGKDSVLVRMLPQTLSRECKRALPNPDWQAKFRKALAEGGFPTVAYRLQDHPD